MAGKALSGQILPAMRSELRPPEYLSPHAREHWSDLVRALGPAGMLSEVDSMALALLCEQLADYWSIREDMPRQADMGFAERIMVTSALGKMDARIREWLKEMLLTPASRAQRPIPFTRPDEQPLDLSVLDADERAAIRAMLERHGDQKVLQ